MTLLFLRNGKQASGSDDRAKPMPLLEESLAISSELGMRPLMERVLSRREILEAYPACFTSRTSLPSQPRLALQVVLTPTIAVLVDPASVRDCGLLYG